MGLAARIGLTARTGLATRLRLASNKRGVGKGWHIEDGDVLLHVNGDPVRLSRVDLRRLPNGSEMNASGQGPCRKRSMVPGVLCHVRRFGLSLLGAVQGMRVFRKYKERRLLEKVRSTKAPPQS